MRQRVGRVVVRLEALQDEHDLVHAEARHHLLPDVAVGEHLCTKLPTPQ